MNIEETITYWLTNIADILVHGGNLGHLIHCARMLEIAMEYLSPRQHNIWRELQYELIGYAYAKEVS